MLQAFMDWQERRIRLQAPVRVHPKQAQTPVEKPRRVVPFKARPLRVNPNLALKGMPARHGTNYGYKLGCRCLLCRQARSTYEREWRAKLRAQAQ